MRIQVGASPGSNPGASYEFPEAFNGAILRSIFLFITTGALPDDPMIRLQNRAGQDVMRLVPIEQVPATTTFHLMFGPQLSNDSKIVLAAIFSPLAELEIIEGDVLSVVLSQPATSVVSGMMVTVG